MPAPQRVVMTMPPIVRQITTSSVPQVSNGDMEIYNRAYLHHQASINEQLMRENDPRELLIINLARELNDIERAKEISKAYEASILKVLSQSDRGIFERVLLKYCPFLGSPSFDSDLFLQDLKNQSGVFAADNFKLALKTFLDDLVFDVKSADQCAKTMRKIAILYTGLGGGGHKAPAMAMRDRLLREEGYQVEMIDTDDIEKDFEPKILGQYGYEDIWTEFYQKKGKPELAVALWDLHDKLYKAEWRKTYEVVRKKLEAFDPDLIFTVAIHKPKLIYLAYRLNKKMIYVYTDNYFNQGFLDIVEMQSRLGKPLIKFTKPVTTPSNYYNALHDGPTTSQTFEPTESFKRQLVDMQIPVRPSFTYVDPETQIEIKKELGINPSAVVCMVAMGNNGVEKEARDILQKIYSERKEAPDPMHFIFICGKNETFATELKGFLQKNSFADSKITVQVEEYLGEKEMAKRAQAADVWIAKMGGSTSAEALVMKKQVLSVSMENHSWEDNNALANHELGLSDPFDKKRKVLPQIMLADAKATPSINIPDWGQQLFNIIDSELQPPINVDSELSSDKTWVNQLANMFS